jgi:hypothetical protein
MSALSGHSRPKHKALMLKSGAQLGRSSALSIYSNRNRARSVLSGFRSAAASLF